MLWECLPSVCDPITLLGVAVEDGGVLQLRPQNRVASCFYRVSIERYKTFFLAGYTATTLQDLSSESDTSYDHVKGSHNAHTTWSCAGMSRLHGSVSEHFGVYSSFFFSIFF